MDISHNNFDATEIKTMRQGLDSNHTILGIHSNGNECTTDGLGFLNEYDLEGIQSIENIGLHAIYTRLPQSLKAGSIKSLNRIRMHATSHCWICEGWTEYQFDFYPEDWVDIITVPVKLHLSCDEYKGEILDINEAKVKRWEDQVEANLKIDEENAKKRQMQSIGLKTTPEKLKEGGLPVHAEEVTRPDELASYLQEK